MSVKYKLVLRKNLKKGAPKDSKLYYAASKTTGQMSFEDVCERIADRSTASDGDVVLVMKGLLKCLKESLERGESVDLGDIGKFRISLGSEGCEKEEQFQPQFIRTPRIVFHPGKELRSHVRQIPIERLEAIPLPQKPTESEPPTGI